MGGQKAAHYCQLVPWAHFSSLQETGICQRCQQEKLSCLNSPIQAIGSFFLPPKADANINSEQTAWMQMWPQQGIFCAWHRVCAQPLSLTSGTKRSIFWKCESNMTALHKVSDPFPTAGSSCTTAPMPFLAQRILQLQAVTPWSLLSPGWSSKKPFFCNHSLSAPSLNPLFPIFPRTWG